MTRRPYDRWKRLIDILLSSIGLALSAPIQLVVAALVGRDLGKPVLFRQQRPGKDERIFELVKFRTMRETDTSACLLNDAERLSKLGVWLRATSLDELPTLWNVLKGDMSLVGPRPLLVQYLQRYDPTQRRRHEVRPGVTGLAQVSGRNSLAWDEKFDRDVEYVDQRSLQLDLKILGRTLAATLRRQGINASGDATMPEFLGSADREL